MLLRVSESASLCQFRIRTTIRTDSDSEYFIDSNFTKFMVIYKYMYTIKKYICVYQGKNGLNIV